MMELNLRTVPEKNHESTKEDLISKEPQDFVMNAYLGAGLQLISDNSDELIKFGIFEAALIFAYQLYTPIKVSFDPILDDSYHLPIELYYATKQYSRHFIYGLFQKANREKMIKAGDEIPQRAEFTLYRGVCNCKDMDTIRGISWTEAIDIAKNYAYLIYSREDQIDPGVFKIEISQELILCKLKGLSEEEYLVDIDRVDNIIKVENRPR